MSAVLSEELTVLFSVLGVFLFIFFVLMVFLCFECMRQKETQTDGNDSRFSWLSFLGVNQKGDSSGEFGNTNLFSFIKRKEQPPATVSTETYMLNDSLKPSYVDIVPQNKGIVKSIAQDSDSESQFSFTSENDQRRFEPSFAPLEASTCGTIICSIKFYHFANRLAVRVGEVQLNLAENIAVNPYVKLHLLPEHKRGNRQTTRVKRNSTLFVCDEDFLFSVGSREVRTKNLSLYVYDYKSNTRHLCIGKVTIDLGEFDFKDEDKPVSLKRHIIPHRTAQDQFGSLEVAVTVSTESLRIGIIKAVGIAPVDLSGTLEPYCRIVVHIGSDMVHKRKTCVAEAINSSPVWEEFFTMDLPAKTLLCDISVTIEVRDHLRSCRPTSYLLMGRVILSNTAQVPGRTHWEHVSSQRGTTVTQWLPILP